MLFLLYCVYPYFSTPSPYLWLKKYFEPLNIAVADIIRMRSGNKETVKMLKIYANCSHSHRFKNLVIERLINLLILKSFNLN